MNSIEELDKYFDVHPEMKKYWKDIKDYITYQQNKINSLDDELFVMRNVGIKLTRELKELKSR